MKNADSVVVRTYVNEVEADLAASWLDAEGIACELVSDDAGGVFPMLQVTRGVKLLVDRALETRALEILERSEQEVDPSVFPETPEAGGDPPA
ncbi:MAG: DUF2007 domain-containing protein [bacterium]